MRTNCVYIIFPIKHSDPQSCISLEIITSETAFKKCIWNANSCWVSFDIKFRFENTLIWKDWRKAKALYSQHVRIINCIIHRKRVKSWGISIKAHNQSWNFNQINQILVIETLTKPISFEKDFNIHTWFVDKSRKIAYENQLSIIILLCLNFKSLCFYEFFWAESTVFDFRQVVSKRIWHKNFYFSLW